MNFASKPVVIPVARIVHLLVWNMSEVDTTKFDTCRFRSDTEIEFGEISCCGAMTQKGWICLERGIEALTPLVCVGCEFYEPRLVSE